MLCGDQTRRSGTPNLHAALNQLDTSRERAQVVDDGLGAVTQDAADLGGGLALQGQADNLGAMGQDRADVMDGAPQGDHYAGGLGAKCVQVARDRADGDEEDAEGQILSGQQRPLT